MAASSVPWVAATTSAPAGVAISTWHDAPTVQAGATYRTWPPAGWATGKAKWAMVAGVSVPGVLPPADPGPRVCGWLPPQTVTTGVPEPDASVAALASFSSATWTVGAAAARNGSGFRPFDGLPSA